MFNIVLVEPEIPHNTGNIIRTCAATNSKLHLIEPLGFSLTDKNLKRAGLDYRDLARVFTYCGLEEFFEKNKDGTFYYLTTKVEKPYYKAKFKDGDFLLFGKETAGLPEDLIFSNADTAITVPMTNDARSLNLSNTVALVVYEALRQTGFKF
ncbi:tRNA (uridine(34)/cytosine(34)/5-carboxymethylaminomethyluridine(34)-2'-O)-methyltransferase TrmL [Proteinivorax hydrogeniformans]|uniref:Putative tRNA (cytidine(34)-2'-O)-methyltransferase n=1 Tax=Proteinivorax hydrogeniformans TaxID=1826727 RepID=A0AAU8HW05_9FIRM